MLPTVMLMAAFFRRCAGSGSLAHSNGLTDDYEPPFTARKLTHCSCRVRCVSGKHWKVKVMFVDESMLRLRIDRVTSFETTLPVAPSAGQASLGALG